MRISLVVHGFPPYELAGVETYTAGLAAALARAGHEVDVLAVRADAQYPNLSLRQEARDGYGLTWLNAGDPPRDPVEQLDPPGLAARFGAYLDLQRPQLVHFQHVIKLGLGLIEEARTRGLATCLTAHDYYGACHRFTLLRPDLERCETIGQPQRCARCDLGLAVLNDVDGLGDYHMGVWPDDLPSDAAERLRATLAGDEAGSGIDGEAWGAARTLRERLDRRRLSVLSQLDRILCPTRFLADRLREVGLPDERIRHLPYGVTTTGLAELERPRPDGRALRIGYVGSMTKHKGVHVLLDALEHLRADGLGDRIELVLHGDSTDRHYVERCAERARALGARFEGPFQPRELPRILGRIDVAVVPSIWFENQPLVIREAFAAGRPVLASRLGAIPESVRDDVDGLLFEPGDGADLGRAIARLVTEEGLFARLQGAVPAIASSDDQARELEPIYAELIAEGALERREQEVAWARELPHLEPLARRYAELCEMPGRELYEAALRGIDRLRWDLGAPESSLATVLANAFGARSRAQERLRDQAIEGAYLRGEVERAHAEHERLSAWREEQLEEQAREVAWLRESVEGLQRSVDSLAHERDWLAGEVEARDRERQWLHEQVEAHRQALAGVERQVAELHEHLEVHAAKVESLADELSGVGFEAGKQSGDEGHELGARLDHIRTDLADLRRELEWRRGQMDEVARRATSSKLRILWRIVPGGGHVRRWEAPELGEDGTGGAS